MGPDIGCESRGAAAPSAPRAQGAVAAAGDAPSSGFFAQGARAGDDADGGASLRFCSSGGGSGASSLAHPPPPDGTSLIDRSWPRFSRRSDGVFIGVGATTAAAFAALLFSLLFPSTSSRPPPP